MIKWVVDGDTLVLDNELRIRLQGIDAPETKQQCADLIMIYVFLTIAWVQIAILYKNIFMTQWGLRLKFLKI